MEIFAQSSADFALTYNFQGTHILGASRGYLSYDSVIFLFCILLRLHVDDSVPIALNCVSVSVVNA